jgi:hypothetical protein
MGRTYLTAGSKLTEWRTPMRQIVDRATFDQVSPACYAVYEAVRFGELAADVASRIEAQTDLLLKTTGNSYLTEVLQAQDPDGTISTEQYSEAFVRIQHLRADLRSLIRQAVQATIERGDMQAAEQFAEKGLLLDAEASFRESRWDEGRDALRGFGMIPSIRFAYYRSFIDEMLAGSPTALQRIIGYFHSDAVLLNARSCFSHDGSKYIPQPVYITSLWMQVDKYLRSHPQMGIE